MKVTNDKFNFFVPATFEKGGEADGKMKVKGVCSSAVEDADGEILEPNGFDFSPLMKSGFFNYNHRGNKDPGAIIGEPTGARIVNAGKDFEIEGFLYPNEQGKATYSLGKTLEAYSPNRRLGWSIEGQVLERDPMNPKRIKKARITGVAITPCPKNPNTLLSIVKGDYQEQFVELDDEGEKEVDEIKKQATEKSMVVDTDINPESVESKKRPTPESSSFLKKSDIYEKIITAYPDSIEKAEQIYSLIIKTNEKLFNMESNQVTSEAINKAFELLDGEINKSAASEKVVTDPEAVEEPTKEVVKGEDNDDDDGEVDEVEKAMQESCDKMVKAGLSKAEVIDRFEKMGVNEAKASFIYDSCIADANAKKDGGSISEMTEVPAIAKAVVDELQKSFDSKFAALGTLLKAERENNVALREEVAELKKGYSNVTEDIQKIEKNAPPMRKSMAKAVERFEKSATGTNSRAYNIASARDVKLLTEELYAHTVRAREEGRPNERLERAVENLEIAKSTDFNSIWADMKALGIEIVNGSGQ